MTTKDNHHLKAVLFKDFNQNECNNRYFFSGLFSFLSGLIISFQVEQDLKGRKPHYPALKRHRESG